MFDDTVSSTRVADGVTLSDHWPQATLCMSSQLEDDFISHAESLETLSGLGVGYINGMYLSASKK